MDAYGIYEDDFKPVDQPNNCLQQAIKIAVEEEVDVVYWVPSQGHFYVVVKDQEYALGNVEFYRRMKAQDVIKFGVPHVITESDRIGFLPKKAEV